MALAPLAGALAGASGDGGNLVTKIVFATLGAS